MSAPQENKIKVAPDTFQYVLGPNFMQEMLEVQLLAKRSFLSRYFTNLDGRVTAVTENMPSNLAAAITARLSRARITDIRELCWVEFVLNEDFGLSHLVGNEDSPGTGKILKGEKSRKLIKRIVDGFGDDSVREQASGYVMVHDASVLMSMETFRLGSKITGIEGSTRYIPYYEKDVSGRYRYVEAPQFFDEEEKRIYEEQNDFAFKTYAKLWSPVWKYVEEKNPRQEGVTPEAYRVAVLGQVCDLLRGLLPMGSKTNFAIHADYRSLSELIISLRASGLAESQSTANLMAQELMKVNPEFIQMVDSPHGDKWAMYLLKTSAILRQFSGDLVAKSSSGESNVEVEILNDDAMHDILATAISMQRPDLSFNEVQEGVIEKKKTNKDSELFKDIYLSRKNRRHKVPAALCAVTVATRFDDISLGAIKDLNRHRKVLAKSELVVDGSRGAYIPEELRNIEGAYEACEAVHSKAVEAYKKLKINHPEEARLVLNHGTKSSLFILMDLAESLWIAELRSIASGNPEYRKFAQDLYRRLIEQIPELQMLGSFVDYADYEMGRLQEAVRSDLRGKS